MSSDVQLGTYVLGEKPPPLTYQFLDSTGSPINISSGYVAEFACQEHDGVPFGPVSAAVSNGAAGQVTYTWTGTEFPTAGRYTAFFWAGNGTTRLASVQINFLVQLPVGAVPGI